MPSTRKSIAEELQKFWDDSDAKAAKEAAKASDAAGEYAAKIVAATDKYVDKCKEVRILQAKLHNLDRFEEGVGDDEDDSPSSTIAVTDDGGQESPWTNPDCRQR